MKWLEVGFGPFSRLDGWVLGVDWNELHFSSALVIRDAYLLVLPRCASPTPRLSSEWVDVTSGFGNLSRCEYRSHNWCCGISHSNLCLKCRKRKPRN